MMRPRTRKYRYCGCSSGKETKDIFINKFDRKHRHDGYTHGQENTDILAKPLNKNIQTSYMCLWKGN